MKFSGITSVESSWSVVLRLLVFIHAGSLVKCLETQATDLVTDVGEYYFVGLYECMFTGF